MVSLDIREIPGTNCYLDERAFGGIKDSVAKLPLEEIHLIGSGNYHYLSYFFLGRVTSPFYLILFDNHPDCQAPAFGDILSCGGWVKRAISDFPMLQKVFIVGASPEHVAEEEPFPEKVVIVPRAGDLTEILEDALVISEEKFEESFGSVGFYISIDKDVLSPEFAITDWDQGRMSIDELCDCLTGILSLVVDDECERINKFHRLVGVDICGDSKSEPNGPDHPVNYNSNMRILEILSEVF